MSGASIPLILKFQEWPEADRQEWDALFAPGVLFEDSGHCSDWTDGTRDLRRQGYGQWLSFLTRTHPGVLDLAPPDRIKPDLIAAYITECDARLKPVSTAHLVLSIYVLGTAMSPADDLDWLARAVNATDRATRSGSAGAERRSRGTG